MDGNQQKQEIDIIDSFNSFLRRQINKPIKIFKAGRYVINVRQGILFGSILYIGFILFTFNGFFSIFDTKTITPKATPSSVQTEDSNTPLLTAQDVNELQDKLTRLESEIAQIKATGQSSQLNQLENELKEIRLAITGDPAKVLSLQRMEFEIANLESRVDGLDSLIKWVFGITLTLALAILGVVLPLIFKTLFTSKNADKE